MINIITKKILLAVVLLTLTLFSAQADDSFTVATFADPALDSTTPLFCLDIGIGPHGMLSGGWDSSGLDLEVLQSTTYNDATFSMTDLYLTNVSNAWFGNQTESGQIDFWANDLSHLLRIEFEAAWVNMYGVGSGLLAENVTITGNALGGLVLEQESFAFSFTNHVHTRTGFTSTASFTSSATPEPATMALLGLGSLAVVKRKRR